MKSANSISAPLRSQIAGHCQIAFFSYSPAEKTLVSWSEDLPALLGAPINALHRDANLFLRYLDAADRFAILDRLEESLAGKSDYCETYQWIRPNNQELRLLHCRGALNTKHDSPLFEGCIVDLTDEISGDSKMPLQKLSSKEILAADDTAKIVLDRDARIIETNWTSHSQDKESVAAWFHFGDENFDSSRIRTGLSFLNAFTTLSVAQEAKKKCELLISGKAKQFSDEIHFGKKVARVRYVPILHESIPHGVLISIEDRTEQEELKQHLLESKRSSTLLKMISSVTRHLDNSLQIIDGQALAIQENLKNPETIGSARKILSQTTKQARSLVKKLVSLQKNTEAAIDLNVVLISVLEDLQSSTADFCWPNLEFGHPPLLLLNPASISQLLKPIFRELSGNLQQQESWSIHTGSAESAPRPLSSKGPYAFISVLLPPERDQTEPLQENPFLHELEKEVITLSGCLAVSAQTETQQELLIHLPIEGAQTQRDA